MSKLDEDLLFALTGDSYGERLHVDTTAASIVEDVKPAVKNLMLELIGKNPFHVSGMNKELLQSQNELRDQLKQKVNEL